MNTINMARIRSCELLEEYDPGAVTVPKGRLKALTLLLHDERRLGACPIAFLPF